MASVSAHPESASQFSAKYWDMLSEWGVLRKLHPRILAQNGMQFPNRYSKGNRIPENWGTANKSRTVTWLGLSWRESRESLMLAGVGAEINEQPERYNDMLWRPYALFLPFCHICFYHCACRNGGYPLSPVFIFDRLGIRCNDLARYPWRMPRGVWSWCCAPQGERNKAAGPPWRLRCFPCCYCGGSRMGRLGLLCSRRFYSNRVCTNLAVTWRFVCLVLHWVTAPLICNLEYGGLSFDAGGDAG